MPAMSICDNLSPHFTRAYVFGAFALTDVGRADLSVKLLERGFAPIRVTGISRVLGYFNYVRTAASRRTMSRPPVYQRAAASRQPPIC